MNETIIRCRLAHFQDGYSSWDNAFQYLDDAIVVIKNEKIDKVIPAQELSKTTIDEKNILDRRPALMLPGFIDAHVHSPQLPMIASYGEQLLDWLQKYTFPAEIECAEQEYSRLQSENFIESLLRHGTTSAFIFTTSYKHNTEDIFNAAHKRNMRIIAGKVLMDRNAPKALLDEKDGIHDSRDLILKYHERGRLGYAITPRFSATSTPEQLHAAGELLKEFPSVWMQTHLSESQSEISWTKQLFPDATDYLNTYETYGLHSNRSIYAHCIHLSESEIKRIADAGSTVAFCPSSNLFLGSGLLNIEALHDAKVQYALASDVGAGTSLSMFKTMGDAYKVNQLQAYSLSPLESYYSSTLGAAKSLNIDAFVGNLAQGKEADFILVDARLDKNISTRITDDTNIQDELFIYMTMGDDRIIHETHVAGKVVYSNPLNQNLFNSGVKH